MAAGKWYAQETFRDGRRARGGCVEWPPFGAEGAVVRTTRVFPALTRGAVALPAGGCAQLSHGEEAPRSNAIQEPSSSTNADLPQSGGPAVSDPLPESVIAGDPCEALTRQQVEQALGGNAPQSERAGLEAQKAGR